MGQVTSGRVNSGTLKHSYFYVNWQQASQSTSTNKTVINWQAGLNTGGATSNYDYWYTNAVKINSLYINGTNVCSGTYSNVGLSGGKDYQLASGSIEIPHNTDGSKSFSISISGWLYTYGDTSGSNTFELVSIPRYATSNQSLNSKTETTITMNWSSDSTIDYVWYSTDWGTTWKAIGSVNATSGSYTIKTQSKDTSNLSANTTYNIITRVRRKDSQLTTNSSKLSVTTYNYPYCTDSPNFVIGNKLTLALYNPLGRSVTVQGIAKSNNAQIFGASNVTETSVSGFNDSGSVATQYASIPNAKSGAYKVVVSYGNVAMTRDNGNTYSIKGTETPTLGSITYADTDTTVTGITGNNQHIVQNKSNLKVSYTSATAKNSATISKHTFELNGVKKESTSATETVDFGKINSASNLTLTVTVTDSRGLTSKTTKTITMLAYNTPTAIVTLNRLNNYEDESYLTVDGSIASVNSKNTMAIKYRYKVSGGSYNSFTTIGDRAKQTLSLDKNNAYIFNVVVTDAFGSTYNREYVLNKGKFPLFIDVEKNAVGINDFPSDGEALKIKDGDLKLEKALNGSPRIQVSNGSVSASLHVGAGGVNRGIWDETDAKWIVFNDGKDVYLNSNLYPMSKGFNNETSNAEIFDDVAENESLHRSGLYSVNDSTTWYNVINVRHRNGHSDGLDYGLQIRKAFGLNATMQVRSQNSKSWSGWEAIFRSKTLYDNTSGTTGTVTLNESVANFSYIEIYFKHNSAGFASQKIHSPNSKVVSLLLAWHSAENNLPLIQYVSKRVAITDTSITNISYGASNNRSDGYVWAGTDTNNLYIVKVVGYR